MNSNSNEEKVTEILEDTEKEVVEPSLEDKVAELEDKYIRALAEEQNTRKRYEKMLQDTTKYSVSSFAKEMVNILDIFNKALLEIKENEEQAQIKSFVEGIKLTHKELEKSLSKFGIKPVGIAGEEFNPNYHEALYSQPNPEKENNTISEVIEEGYVIHDRLLKPAKVGVIKNV